MARTMRRTLGELLSGMRVSSPLPASPATALASSPPPTILTTAPPSSKSCAESLRAARHARGWAPPAAAAAGSTCLGGAIAALGLPAATAAGDPSPSAVAAAAAACGLCRWILMWWLSILVQFRICQLRYCCWNFMTLVQQYMVDRPWRGTALMVTWCFSPGTSVPSASTTISQLSGRLSGSKFSSMKVVGRYTTLLGRMNTLLLCRLYLGCPSGPSANATAPSPCAPSCSATGAVRAMAIGALGRAAGECWWPGSEAGALRGDPPVHSTWVQLVALRLLGLLLPGLSATTSSK
mmetsp:Transcript_18598/g.47126  ORF Transcript_18598/g.47126 Transcript_18598/m.47126 type:complete len:294 (+) Transcript_18598:360-1241(+)